MRFGVQFCFFVLGRQEARLKVPEFGLCRHSLDWAVRAGISLTPAVHPEPTIGPQRHSLISPAIDTFDA